MTKRIELTACCRLFDAAICIAKYIFVINFRIESNVSAATVELFRTIDTVYTLS